MWVQPGLCDEEWWCGCLSGAGVHWGAECGWRWSSSFSGNLRFWGACLLPTPKWAHGCWVQPRLPARDCKVLLWRGKRVWIRLSSLNFSKMEYCSIFIITLEKHQNNLDRTLWEGQDLGAGVWTDPMAQAPCQVRLPRLTTAFPGHQETLLKC